MNTKVNQKEKQYILRKGEQQRSNGTFGYQWSDNEGKRHIIYAKTLPELRAKE